MKLNKLISISSALLFLATFLFIPFSTHAQWILKTNGLPEGLENPFCIGTYGCNIALISVTSSSVQRPLYYTSDTGNNWNKINWPGDTMQIETVIDLCLTGPDTFYIGTETGRIFKTTDTGNTWTLQFANDTLTNFINYIEIFDSDNGIAMGDGVSGDVPVFLKTTNGGVNWNSVNSQPIGQYSGDIWRRVDFVNPDTGYFYETGINPQKLYKTTDGGVTWNETNFNSSASLLKFYDDNFGLITNFSEMYKTIDGGTNWNTITNLKNALDIEYISKDKILAVNDSIYYSTDGGGNWNGYYLGVTGYDMEIKDSTCGWILAWNGKVFFNNNLDILTSFNERISSAPIKFSLLQNYPNPFNPSTKIKYSVSNTANGAFVNLKIYDVLGREIATLVNENKRPGEYEVTFNGSKYPSGIYIYRIEANNYTASKKMILLK